MMVTHKVEEQGARKAFEVLQPQLDELEALRRITVDGGKAAALVASIGRTVQQREVRDLFAQLPDTVFDQEHVDNLEMAGLAMWHASVEHMRASVGASRGRVPAEVVAEATELRQRMLMVAEYCLADDEAVHAELADIRQGKGYADLAADLLRLERLYEAHEDVLAEDRRHYRPEQRHQASELAHRIHAYLGDGADSQARHWAEYVQRAWTFMVDTYEEVSAAGRWLYRHENGEEMFPSLFSAMRRSRSPREADSAAQADSAAAQADSAAAQADSAAAQADSAAA